MERSRLSWVLWIVIAAVIFTVLATAYSYSKSPSFLEAPVANALATLAGVAIGIPVGLQIDSLHSRETRRVRKGRILLALRDELWFNRAMIEGVWKGEDAYSKATYYVTALKDNLWRALSDGGEIQWIDDVDLLHKISAAYHEIVGLRALADRIYTVMQFDARTGAGILTKGLNDHADHMGSATQRDIDIAIDAIADAVKRERLAPKTSRNAGGA